MSVSCRTFRVIDSLYLQEWTACMDKPRPCMDSLYLQESAQLNFTHMQREMAISLSIFAAQFKNLGTPFATAFLANKALKDCRGTEWADLHNSVPVQRKLEKKLASPSTIIPPVRVHGETTREPRSILKQDSFSPSRRCLRLLSNISSAWLTVRRPKSCEKKLP